MKTVYDEAFPIFYGCNESYFTGHAGKRGHVISGEALAHLKYTRFKMSDGDYLRQMFCPEGYKNHCDTLWVDISDMCQRHKKVSLDFAAIGKYVDHDRENFVKLLVRMLAAMRSGSNSDHYSRIVAKAKILGKDNFSAQTMRDWQQVIKRDRHGWFAFMPNTPTEISRGMTACTLRNLVKVCEGGRWVSRDFEYGPLISTLATGTAVTMT